MWGLRLPPRGCTGESEVGGAREEPPARAGLLQAFLWKKETCHEGEGAGRCVPGLFPG